MGRKIAHDKSFQTLRINAIARSASCVIMRCSSEAVKNLWEAKSVVRTACVYTGAEFFHLFPKIKRSISSVATPLRVHMLRTYSAVVLVLAINSLKMKQMIVFFCFAVVQRLRAGMISKKY